MFVKCISGGEVVRVGSVRGLLGVRWDVVVVVEGGGECMREGMEALGFGI